MSSYDVIHLPWYRDDTGCAAHRWQQISLSRDARGSTAAGNSQRTAAVSEDQPQRVTNWQSSKLQTPSSREIPNSKSQCRSRCRSGHQRNPCHRQPIRCSAKELFWSLELGAWNCLRLGFATAAGHSGRTTATDVLRASYPDLMSPQAAMARFWSAKVDSYSSAGVWVWSFRTIIYGAFFRPRN